MKLDANIFRLLSKNDFRVLTAVELGMRIHEIVPSNVVARIAELRNGTHKVLKELRKHKFLENIEDGFRLTSLGYDCLAIKTMVNRGVITAIGLQVYGGQDSDIFEVATEDGTVLAMKLHRLGRTSFKALKSECDNFNWLYMSHLSALKEFALLKALHEHDFPVPDPVVCNRHCVIMSFIQGYTLVQVKKLQNPAIVLESLLGEIVRLAEHGLIHCDFNEFNIMIDDDEKITILDFPLMVSVSHQNAQMYFDRDVECIFKFFSKRFNMSFPEDADRNSDENLRPRFSSITKVSGFLDKELASSGFTKKDQDEIAKLNQGYSDCDSDEEDELPNSNSDEQLLTQDTSDQSCINSEGTQSNGPETPDSSDQEENGERQKIPRL